MSPYSFNYSNKTIGEELTPDDAAWSLSCSFLILTMQTGFAMLECGCVSPKNTANIMIKNFCDVVIGGLAYWMFGFALTFGRPSNQFCGYGDFFYTIPKDTTGFGTRYAKYFFQFSFASTATTIVSGAVAERMKLHAYMFFAFFNIVSYSIPASWCWNETGFLSRLGFYDFAGVCAVHLSGGASALVATLMLGPREDRWTNPERYDMSSPVASLTGMFMLTWAWLGFNCGSTFGVTGMKWKVTALVAVNTLNGGIGGGLAGLIISMAFHQNRVLIEYVITSLLAGLVAVTGICSITTPYEALFIGLVGGVISVATIPMLEYFKVDDPVGAVPVHFFAAAWGTIAVGLFGDNNPNNDLSVNRGLVHSGSIYLLGVNTLGALLVGAWSGGFTFLILAVIKYTVGIRVSLEHERLGADVVEHKIDHNQLGLLGASGGGKPMEETFLEYVHGLGARERRQLAKLILQDANFKSILEELIRAGSADFDTIFDDQTPIQQNGTLPHISQNTRIFRERRPSHDFNLAVSGKRKSILKNASVVSFEENQVRIADREPNPISVPRRGVYSIFKNNENK